MATATQNKIRIRLKAYDHSAIETAAKEIVETATRTGATVSGPVPLPTEKNVYCVIRSPVQGQGLARALRDPHAQAAHRHPPADAEDGRLAPAPRPPARRRRHRDPPGRLTDARDPRQEARDDPALPGGRPRRARHRPRGRAVPRHRRSARSSATATRPSSSRSARSRRSTSPSPSSAISRRPTRRRMKHVVEFRDEAGELHGRRDGQGRRVRRGRPGQDLRRLQGQGLPGHDQAPRLRQRPQVARLAQRARAGLDRRRRVSRARLQGHPRPGPDGQQARDPEGPDGRRASTPTTTCCSCAAPSRARATASWRCAPMADAPILGAAKTKKVDARRRRLRRALQRPARARVRARRAQRAPPGHRVDQDARQRPRRRRQAVAPEGHRPRPRRLVALADLDRRRRRLRPPAAPLHLQGQPQGAPRRAAQRAERARRPRHDRDPRPVAASTTPSTKQAARAASPTGPAAARCSSSSPRSRPTCALSFRNLRRVSVLPVEQLGVADLVGAASLLISEDALDELTKRAKGEKRPPRADEEATE